MSSREPVSALPLPAIADYGMIGDTRTAALCSALGSIDWLCLPRFDSEPVFGRLVGGQEAGTFTLAPADEEARASGRRYRGDSAVLETTWRTPSSELTLTEGMVGEVRGTLLPANLVVRRMECRGGPASVIIDFDPRRGPGSARPRVQHRRGVVVCSWGPTAVGLQASPAVPVHPGRAVEVTVAPGRPLTLAMSASHREPLVHVDPELAWRTLGEDAARWQEWAAGIDYQGPFRTAVVRSLLTLRLLTYSPSGAPVAAPTTSLPEQAGGGRNWDYRYAWPRDASIGVASFLAVGKAEEARAFLYWLLHASRLDRPRLPVVLTLDGKPVPPERQLAEWPGYAGSRPVRVGNGARDQHQLDVYGWVLDAAWALAGTGERLYGETWRALSCSADLVARCWAEPDAGVWEVRGRPAHYVHSKLMAWLAVDRALRIADTHPASTRRRHRWDAARHAIAAEVTVRGFDAARGSFVRAYGRDDLDAALLLVPVIGLEDPLSPRVVGTVDAVRRELAAGGPLLHRYAPGGDGLEGSEGAFLACSFWLVQALAHTGRLDEAHELFAQLEALASPLGLFAEEMDPATGAHLGNFPQALTHAALVQAALALEEVRRGRGAGPGPGRRPDGR